MHIDRDEVDFLSDPRYPSGYWHVYKCGQKYAVEFTHHYCKVVKRKFLTAFEAAKWVAWWFKKRYGEDWPNFIWPSKSESEGPGWKIIKSGNRFRLHVCPCGEWCKVGHKESRRLTDEFPSPDEALAALDRLHRHVWPLYGRRILDPIPYCEPRRIVIVPARVG